MAKKFTYKGKSIEELKEMELKEFVELLPSRQRRSLLRGFTDEQKKLLKKIDATVQGKYKKPIKTHCRDMIILPKMVDLTLHVHRGNNFMPVTIPKEAIGMYLGELVLTREKVAHSAAGVGATKSSKAISVR